MMVASTVPPRTRWLLAAGAVAGVLFVALFLIEGATRAGYDPLRQPVSSLSIGEGGWTQRLNFFLTGVLTVLFAIGIRLRTGSNAAFVLIGLVGIGFCGAGFFTADPYNGYPPGTPLIPLRRTTSGVLHDLLSALVFLGLPAAAIVLGRRFRKQLTVRWGWYSICSAIAFVIAFVLTAVGLNQTAGLAAVAGLLQRLTLAIGFAWMFLVSVRLSRGSVGRLFGSGELIR